MGRRFPSRPDMVGLWGRRFLAGLIWSAYGPTVPGLRFRPGADPPGTVARPVPGSAAAAAKTRPGAVVPGWPSEPWPVCRHMTHQGYAPGPPPGGEGLRCVTSCHSRRPTLPTFRHPADLEKFQDSGRFKSGGIALMACGYGRLAPVGGRCSGYWGLCSGSGYGPSARLSWNGWRRALSDAAGQFRPP